MSCGRADTTLRPRVPGVGVRPCSPADVYSRRIAGVADVHQSCTADLPPGGRS